MARARASLPSTIRFFHVALSNRNGTATLYKDAEITGLASLTKRDLDCRGIKMSLTETVQCRTLDNVVEEENVEHIDLLKIDVEGHELDVLKGECESFDAGKISLVQFEFGGCNLDTRTTMSDFFRFFQPLGYTLHLVRPVGGIAPLPRYDEIFEQYQTTNYLAIKLPATHSAKRKDDVNPINAGTA
jgi:FkbM family methyltransferase